MIVFPSIDLLNRKAVRLYKGDRNNKKVYGDAFEIAKEHKISGAKRLHLVDLDGAFDNVTVNKDIIRKIKEELDFELQVGGGIKTLDKIEYYLKDLRVDKIILGTVCVSNIDLVKTAVEQFGADKIIAGVDANNEYIMTNGWGVNSNVKLDDLVCKLKDIGIQRYIYTDISKDGTLYGMNLQRTKKLQDDFNIDVIASGGLKSIADIMEAKQLNIFGCIIGKAYYEGAIDIKEAVMLEGN